MPLSAIAAADLAFDAPDYLVETNVGALSLSPEINRLRGSTTCGSEEIVQQITVDSKSFSDVRLIKIDVEGMELSVLRGAVETIHRSGFPPIIFEAWKLEWFKGWRDELVAFVVSLGYSIREFGDNNIAEHPASTCRVTRF